MKKINMIELSNSQMDNLSGGNSCTCSCYWADQGGSSIEDNRRANYDNNYYSEHGCSRYGETDYYYYYWDIRL